jgi:hypothetical protein
LAYVWCGIAGAFFLWILEMVIRDGVKRGIEKSLGDLQSTITDAVAAGIAQAKEADEE